jgi:hypothetical protein
MTGEGPGRDIVPSLGGCDCSEATLIFLRERGGNAGGAWNSVYGGGGGDVISRRVNSRSMLGLTVTQINR